MANTPSSSDPGPKSLEGHTVPSERLDLIRPHVAALAATALVVSDILPLEADGADFVATLEREGE